MVIPQFSCAVWGLKAVLRGITALPLMVMVDGPPAGACCAWTHSATFSCHRFASADAATLRPQVGRITCCQGDGETPDSAEKARQCWRGGQKNNR